MDQWVTPSILSMFEPPYCRLKRRPGGEVMLDDLAPGRTPHTLVAQDVGERRVERADSVRHADDERMQADRHNASRLRSLAVEGVELAADHELELIRRPAGAEDLWQIVDLPGVRDRAQALAPDVHQIGLIVVDPVGEDRKSTRLNSSHSL